MTVTAASDRRHFWRAAFDAPIRLIDAAGVTEAHLLDLSLKGALVEVAPDWPVKLGESCQLHLVLAEDAAINMWTTATHIEGRRVGLRCDRIDLDSITHLRRLVELNAGDAGLLDRELSVLLRGG
ncbi:MAG: PilZ domain-containing protein [Rhodocyclaceae bacterium]|nr:MAG: PilZ domain-containing protein [Rhodocyclaceae bacterium]